MRRTVGAYRSGLAALGWLLALASCGPTVDGTPAPAAPTPPATRAAPPAAAATKEQTTKEDTMKEPGEGIDPEKARRATAVLRVKRVASRGGDKWAWDTVEVLAVIKAPEGTSFGGTLDVAHYSWEPGVPDRACVVYLEPYAEEGEKRWKLLGGSAREGVD